MNRLLWTSAAFAAAVALALGIVVVSREPASEGQPAVATDRRTWQYSWPDTSLFTDLADRFDLGARMTFGELPQAAVRLVINGRAELGVPVRGIYVDVARDLLVVGRIEGGVAVPRGTVPVALAPARAFDVVVKRRGAELAVTIDGALHTLALDGTFERGGAAVAVMGDADVQVRPPRRLSELPEFADDFMRSAEDPSPWTVHAGTWKTLSLSTPSMSANAFRYQAQAGAAGTPAFASAGDASWDDYLFQTSVRGGRTGSIGLAVCVAAPDRYVLFSWTARTEGDAGRRELAMVEPGEPGSPRRTVLASAEGGYAGDQWYRLGAAVTFGRIDVSVDGNRLLGAECPGLTSGGIGLWCDGTAVATFDDVLVAPLRRVDERAASRMGCGDWKLRWDAVGGEWRRDADAIAGDARAADRDVKLVSGSGEWLAYSARTTLRPAGPARAGIVAAYRDEGDHVLLAADTGAGTLTLERVGGGQRLVLDTAPLPPAESYDLGIRSDRGYLAGLVGGTVLVEAWDRHAVRGRVGVFVGRNGAAAFDSFGTMLLAHEHQVPTENAVFETDQLMADWADTSSDWYRSEESAGGRDIYWHTALFHGDVELALDLPALEVPQGMAVLGIAKSPTRPQNGYGWKLAPAGDAEGAGAGAWHLTLTREGTPVREVSLDSGQAIHSVFVRRQGSCVSAGVNGEPIAEFADDEPLAGGRVAFLTSGMDVEPMSARLYGGRVFDYRFNEAPVDWRSAAGQWEVTNRWKCDPRWSFYSGLIEPDSAQKAIVNWNKRSFPGDVVIDFYVGPKMEPDRGKRYEYARDFNVTIAADGRDLTSGYSFVFGGFKNSRTGIYRGTKALVETEDVTARIPQSMIIHQRWYHVRVRRDGNRLSYHVYFNDRNTVSLECEDDAPLTGDRIAIWSYDCNISVARMRIAPGSADAGGFAPEHPDASIGSSVRTLYDTDTPPAAEGAAQ